MTMSARDVDIRLAEHDIKIATIERRFDVFEKIITDGFASVNDKLDQVIQAKEEAHQNIYNKINEVQIGADKSISKISSEIARLDTRTNIFAGIYLAIAAIGAYISQKWPH